MVDPHAALKQIPVLLISSKNDPETRRRALQSGADGFLSKPLDGDKLEALVKQLVWPDGDAPRR